MACIGDNIVRDAARKDKSTQPANVAYDAEINAPLFLGRRWWRRSGNIPSPIVPAMG